MKIKTLLEQEIDKSYEKLWKFSDTQAFDRGVRCIEMEYYIEGLNKAKRLINKQNKLNK